MTLILYICTTHPAKASSEAKGFEQGKLALYGLEKGNGEVVKKTLQ